MHNPNTAERIIFYISQDKTKQRIRPS